MPSPYAERRDVSQPVSAHGMMGDVAVTRDELDAAIGELGLPGRVVCVHSSLRSFGTVDGGADTVIDAVSRRRLHPARPHALVGVRDEPRARDAAAAATGGTTR